MWLAIGKLVSAGHQYDPSSNLRDRSCEERLQRCKARFARKEEIRLRPSF